MGFKIEKGDGPNSDINITPLIDVVLVLLIIFMVLTPRTVEEMSANLPSKKPIKQDTPKDPKDQLLVAAYADGEVALNLNLLTKRELFEQLKQRLRARDKRVVFLDAHPDLDYATVVAVMDLIRDAGADRVGLARMKDEGPKHPDDVEGEGAAEGAEGAEPG